MTLYFGWTPRFYLIRSNVFCKISVFTVSIMTTNRPNLQICSQLTLGQLLLITMVGSDQRQAKYSDTGLCSTDAPATVRTVTRIMCMAECISLASCRDFNHNSSNNKCALFSHKPLFHASRPGCAGFKASKPHSFGLFITID